MYPKIYDQPLRTVESILSELHRGGLVSDKDQRLLSEADSPESEDNDSGTIPDPPDTTLPSRDMRLKEEEARIFNLMFDIPTFQRP